MYEMNLRMFAFSYVVGANMYVRIVCNVCIMHAMHACVLRMYVSVVLCTHVLHVCVYVM